MMAYQQTTANNVTADGARASMLWPGTDGETFWTELCKIGAVTTDLETPIIEGTVPATDTASTAAGLNIQMDQDTAADLGFEMTLGGPHGNNSSNYIVGADSGYFDISFFCAQWTSYDAISIGFRKAAAYETGHAPIIAAGTGDPVYTDFVTFGIQESDKIQYATRLNDAGSTSIYTDSSLTPTDSQNVRLRVTLASDGAVTYSLVQNAVAGAGTLAAGTDAVAYTFDKGDTVIPYFFIHGKNHDDTALLLKDIEIYRAG